MKEEETDTQKDSRLREALFTEIVADQDQEIHRNLRRGLCMKWFFLIDSIEQMLVAKFGMNLSIDDIIQTNMSQSSWIRMNTLFVVYL